MEQINCCFGIDDFSKLKDINFLHYFIKTCDEIKSSNEKLCCLYSIFSTDDNDNVIYDYINDRSSLEQKYVKNVLHKVSKYIENHTQLEKNLSNTCYDDPNCAFGYMPKIQQQFCHFFISELKSLNNIRITLLSSKSNFENIYEDFQKCFSNLYFNKINISFKEYEKSDIYELVSALNILNEEGMIVFNECNKDAGEALKKLSSKFSTTGKQTTCSGSNDPKRYRKKIEINDNEFEINISPHIKLNNSYSNKRIYFAWGNDEIANGKIVVYIINGHI